MVNDSLLKENIAKEKEIRKLHKDVQQYEKTISNLRVELSRTNVHNSEMCTAEVGVMAGPCLTEPECGDWEPVRDFTKMLQDETEQFQDRIQKMEANLKSSNENILTLRKVNVSLTEEVHAMRRFCVALVEENRSATVRAQFKDDIIREMRRQLKQAKAKVHRFPLCYFSSKSTSSPVKSSKGAAVDSTIDVSVIEPSPPITVSDASNESRNLCNPFKYMFNKARHWSEPGTSKSSLKIQTYEHKSDLGSDKSKECFKNKSDPKISKRVKAEPLKIKDDCYETPQHNNFCDKIKKISEDKRNPHYEFCDDVITIGANSEIIVCENPDCPVKAKDSMLIISNKAKSEALKIEDSDDLPSPCISISDDIERILADTESYQNQNQYCPLHAEGKNVSTCSTQTVRNELANTSSGFQGSGGTGSLVESTLPGISYCDARFEHITNKLRSALQIIKFQEETIKEQQGSLSLAENRIASLTERVSEMRLELDQKSKEVALLRKNAERNRECKGNVNTCSSDRSDVENQSDIVNTLQNNLNIIEELYRQCFYETAKQEDLIDMLRTSYLDVRLQDKHKTEQIVKMQTVIDEQNCSLERCQDIALEVDSLKAEICNFLSSSTSINNDSGMWERSEESYASIPGVQEELQEIMEQLLTLKELLTLECAPLNVENKQLEILKQGHKKLEQKLKETCAKMCALHKALASKEKAEKMYKEQLEHLGEQLDIATKTIEQLEMECPKCKSLSSQLQQMQASLAEKSDDVVFMKNTCDLQQKTIAEISEKLKNAKNMSIELDIATKTIEQSEMECPKCKSLSSQLQQMQASLAEKSDDVVFMKNTCDSQQKTIAEISEKLKNAENLSIELDIATKTIEQLEMECPKCKSLSSQLQQMQESLAEKSDEVVFMKNNCDSQKKTIAEISERLNNAENLSIELQEANEKLNVQYKKLQEQAGEQCGSELQKVLELKEKAEKEYKKEIELRDEQLKDAACSIKNLEDKINEKNAQCESLNAQLRQMNVSLDENDDKLMLLSKTKEVQQKNIEQLIKELHISEALCKELQNENNFIKQEQDKKDRKLRELCGCSCRLKKALAAKEKAEKQYIKQIEDKDEQLAEVEKQLKKYAQDCSEKTAWCESLTTKLLQMQALLAEREDELTLRKKTCDSQQKTIMEISQELNDTGSMRQENNNIRKEVLNLTSQIEKWRAKLEESEARVCKMDAKFRELENCYKQRDSEAGELRTQLERARVRGAELCSDAQRMLARVRRWARRMRRRHRLQEEQIKERGAYIEFLQKQLKNYRCTNFEKDKDTTDDELSSSNSYMEPTYDTKNSRSFHSEVPSYSSNSLRCKRNPRKWACSEKCSLQRRPLVSWDDKTSLQLSEPDKCPEPTCTTAPRCSQSEVTTAITMRRSPELAWFDRTANQTPEVNKRTDTACANVSCCSQTEASSSRLLPTDLLLERMDQLTQKFYSGWKRWNLNTQNR